MKRKIKISIWTIFCGWMFLSCAQHSDQRIINKSGGYSINKLSDWNYEMKNRSTMITKDRQYDTLTVYGTLIVARGNSALSLDSTFTLIKNDLPNTLKDFQKISEGYSEINGHPVRWLKSSYTLYEFRYISIRYYMMLYEKKSVMIECSSIDGTFEDFEEDFNKMIFSFKVERQQ